MKRAISFIMSICILCLCCSFTFSESDTDKGSSISSGMYHSVAVDKNGNLYTWGDNSFGQLGTGNTENVTEPFCVMTDVSFATCGGYTTAAVTSDGSLYIWGKNGYGIFGNGETADRHLPLKAADDARVCAVSNFHMAYISTDGTLYMTGNNNYGQLGTGNTQSHTSFVEVMKNCAYVSLGQWHTAVITENGELYTWGANTFAQLGSGEAATPVPQPYPVKVMENITHVACAESYTLALAQNGDLYGFGSNPYTILQYNSDGDSVPAASPMLISHDISSASAGKNHFATVTNDGSLIVYGLNLHGQIGMPAESAMYMNGHYVMDNAEAVSCGELHTLVLTKDGEVFGFGNNTYGQSAPALDFVTHITTPNKVADGVAYGVAYAALARQNVLFINADGDLYVWGNGVRGQLGNGISSFYDTPRKLMENCTIASYGLSHGAAVSEGKLYTWGSYAYTQEPEYSTPEVKLDDCVYTDCGEEHTAAITSDGDLYVWGDNSYGQVGVPGREFYTEPQFVMEDVQKVVCGTYNTFAVTKSGELYAWGANTGGELGTGENTGNVSEPVKIADGVVDVSASFTHSAYITQNGEVYGMGDCKSGALGEASNSTSLYSPVRIFEGYDIEQIACGNGHTVFLTSDGKVYTCGTNAYGQLCDNSENSRQEPSCVAENASSVYAAEGVTGLITENGELYMCGLNTYALCALPCEGALYPIFGEAQNAAVSSKSALHYVGEKKVEIAENDCKYAEFDVDDISYRDSSDETTEAYAYYYDSLNTYGKHMYEVLDRALPAAHEQMSRERFDVPLMLPTDSNSIPLEAAMTAWNAYILDHPEVCFISGKYISHDTPFDSGFSPILVFDSVQETVAAERMLDEKLTELTQDKNFSGLRTAYDAIVSLRQADAGESKDAYDHTPCAVFDEDATPSSRAYALVMKAVCDRLGIRSVIIRGTVNDADMFWLNVQADDGNSYALDPYYESLTGVDCFLKGADFMENRIRTNVPRYKFPELSETDYTDGDYTMYTYEPKPIYSYTYNAPLTDVETCVPEDNKRYIVAAEFNGSLYALRAQETEYCDRWANGLAAEKIIQGEAVHPSLIWTAKYEGIDLQLENAGKYIALSDYAHLDDEPNGLVYDPNIGRLYERDDSSLRLWTGDFKAPAFDSAKNTVAYYKYSRIVFIEAERLLGDCNEDGDINTADAVTLLKYAADMIVLSDSQKEAADMNGDTVINTGDAVHILMYCAGTMPQDK
ncbi:MAG: hypothetical protein IJO93_02525 [Clostridia bacterium]|nr:hypothetical protein [Clostridia bacterium]